MKRPSSTADSTAANRRQWLADRLGELAVRGKSKSGLARRLALHPTRVTEMISGKRGMDASEVRAVAEYLEWPAETLLEHLDPGGPSMRPGIPIVGYVGAGALVLPIDESQTIDEAEPPPTYSPSTVAVVVRGDSMYPAYREGDLIYYDDEPASPDLALGRAMRQRPPECVVRLADGRVMIKQLTRGSAPGRYTLLSYNAEPIIDVELQWAVTVRWVRRGG